MTWLVTGARSPDACGGASGGDQPEGDSHRQAEGGGPSPADRHQRPQQGHRRQGQGHAASAQGPQGTAAVRQAASKVAAKDVPTHVWG